MYSKLTDMDRNLLWNILEIHSPEILKRWENDPHANEIFIAKGIYPGLFIEYFGSRILNCFISVLREEQLPGQCPDIAVMLKFFIKHQIALDEVYTICSGKKNIVIDILLESGIKRSNKILKAAVNLFDQNFSGVIKVYLEESENNQQKSSYQDINDVEEDIVIPPTKLRPGFGIEQAKEYFAKDEDGSAEKILFRNDHAEDMLEYFKAVPSHISFAMINSSRDEIEKVFTIFHKSSLILSHYSPYLDALAASMDELSIVLRENMDLFMDALMRNNDEILHIFNAVSSDMERYIERFSVESIAMENTHHIHEPTTLSIRQIISMFVPDHIEECEVEFF